MIRSSGSKELLRPDLLKLIERADFRTFVIYSEAPPWDRPVPWRSSPASPRAGCTIHNECVTDHKACAWTAKPKNGSGDLLGLTKSPNRLISHDLFHCVGFLGEHVCNHRPMEEQLTMAPLPCSRIWTWMVVLIIRREQVRRLLASFVTLLGISLVVVPRILSSR